MPAARTQRTPAITILNTAQTSNAVNLSLGLPCTITVPASLAGLTSVTFTRSDSENGTYTPITNMNSGATNYSVTLTASKTIPLDKNLMMGAGWVKVVGDTTTSADIVFYINFVEAA